MMSSIGGSSATARTPLRRNGAGRLSAAAAAAAATAKNKQVATATKQMPPPDLPAASTTAAAEPPMPPDHYPATVYRYTKTRGWERYRSSTPQSVAARSRRRLVAAAADRQGGASGAELQAQMQMEQTVCAVPRRGCVEVRALRLRIRLFAEDHDGGENNSSSNNNNPHQGGSAASDEGIPSSGGGGTSSSRENTLVIRRSSRVLLSSRRNLGAIVLKFRSVSRAVDFCSRLMQLNAPSSGGKAGSSSLGSAIGGGGWMNDPMSLSGPPSLSTMGMATMGTACGFGAAPTFGGMADGTASAGGQGQQQQQEADTSMASYMVRLLHDPSFLRFVNSMESTLTNSVAGGELMLKALAMSSANTPAAPVAATAVAGAAGGGSAYM